MCRGGGLSPPDAATAANCDSVTSNLVLTRTMFASLKRARTSRRPLQLFVGKILVIKNFSAVFIVCPAFTKIQSGLNQ
jgi:hypothetical protein